MLLCVCLYLFHGFYFFLPFFSFHLFLFFKFLFLFICMFWCVNFCADSYWASRSSPMGGNGPVWLGRLRPDVMVNVSWHIFDFLLGGKWPPEACQPWGWRTTVEIPPNGWYWPCEACRLRQRPLEAWVLYWNSKNSPLLGNWSSILKDGILAAWGLPALGPV